MIKKIMLFTHSILFLLLTIIFTNMRHDVIELLFLLVVILSAYIVTTNKSVFKTWLYYTLNISLMLSFSNSLNTNSDLAVIIVIVGINILLWLINDIKTWIKLRKEKNKDKKEAT